jgi:putative acetyltransferase
MPKPWRACSARCAVRACHTCPTCTRRRKICGFFREHVVADCEVWVAKASAIDGFVAFRKGWVDHLYVRPACHGRGLGTALLDQAMKTHPALRLWAFQNNEQAIAFYSARGFREIERTDGSRNEERMPDILFEWRRS